MLIYMVDARYAPEIERAIRNAVRSCRMDEQFRLDGKQYLRSDCVDETRTGQMLVVIGSASEETITAALPAAVTEGFGLSLGAHDGP